MLRVRLLGDLALELDGEPLAAPEARRARELLGWLALHPGMHARSELAARFWPDVLDTSARASLRTALHELRRSLGERGAAHLGATRDRAGLDGELWVDVLEVERLAAASRLREALELCRGELLAGVDGEWLLPLRDEQREREAQLHERLAVAAEEAGDMPEALRRTREQLRLDPLSEEATRRLMARLAAAGDRPAALSAYARLSDRLRRELGTPPSPQTRELAGRIRAGGAEAALRAAAAPPRMPLPAALHRHTRSDFVGRAEASARLRSLLAAARAGERRTAFVTGEPGIGKSRLVAELCRTAHAGGALVLFGRCYEEALTPYQPFVEALGELVAAGHDPGAGRAELARLLPGLAADGAEAGASGDPEGARYRLFEAVRGLLAGAAGDAPIVLALDDLHWADRATLLLLAHLLRSAEPARLLTIGTYRESELSRSHPLAGALADLRRDALFERIALDGLDDAAVAGLVGAWLGHSSPPQLGRALRERTGGNPFFLEEVLSQLAESGAGDLARAGIPESVKEALGRRLSGLGEACERVLAAAAVTGREFDLALLERLPELDGLDVLAALEEALAAQLLREEPGRPGRYGFWHPLVRETLYEEQSLTRRVRLHRSVASALERLHEGELERHLAELAVHHLAAAAGGDAGHAVDIALAAARRATGQMAYEEAARICRLALEALDGADGPLRREVALELGEALMRAGEPDAARRAFAGVAREARAAGEAELLARAALGHSGLGVSIIAVDERSVRLLREALDLAPPDGALRARLVAALAVETYYASGAEERRALGDEAVAIARRSGDERALVEALNARRVALWSPDCLRERLDTAAELIEAAERSGQVEGVLQGRNWLVADLMEAGELDAARREIEAHERLAARLRLPAYEWWGPMWRSTLALLAGRWDEAERLIAGFAEIGRRAQDRNAELYAEIQAAHMQLMRERYDDLRDHMLERELDRPAGYAYRAGYAWLYAEAGREQEARELLEWVAADGFARMRDDMNHLPALVELAFACAALHAAPHAAELYGRLLPYAERNVLNARGVAGYGSAQYPLGLLASLTGDRASARRHLERAVERNGSLGARHWLARSRLALAELVSEAEPERARELALAAAGEAEALGLALLAQRGRGAAEARATG